MTPEDLTNYLIDIVDEGFQPSFNGVIPTNSNIIPKNSNGKFEISLRLKGKYISSFKLDKYESILPLIEELCDRIEYDTHFILKEVKLMSLPDQRSNTPKAKYFDIYKNGKFKTKNGFSKNVEFFSIHIYFEIEKEYGKEYRWDNKIKRFKEFV